MSSDNREPQGRSEPLSRARPVDRRITWVLVLGAAAVILVLAGSLIGVAPACVALALVPAARREVAARADLGAASWSRAGKWQLRIGIVLAASALLLVVLALVLTVSGFW
jgi:hypothetical protein